MSKNVIQMSTKRPPSGLSSEARQLWRDIIADYEIDDAAGLAILRQLVEALDRLRQCQKEIAAGGLMVKGSTGQPRPHPMLKAEAEFRRLYLAHFRALRLDPGPEAVK